MARVCLFDPSSGPIIEDWPDETIASRFAEPNTVYHCYRVSLLSATRIVDEAIVAATGPLTPAEEFVVFRTLFPDRGGVFQIEKFPD